MKRLSSYDAHKAAGHDDCRHSPNGVSTIVECETCRLAWLMPSRIYPNDRPTTLPNWMSRLKKERKS